MWSYVVDRADGAGVLRRTNASAPLIVAKSTSNVVPSSRVMTAVNGIPARGRETILPLLQLIWPPSSSRRSVSPAFYRCLLSSRAEDTVTPSFGVLLDHVMPSLAQREAESASPKYSTLGLKVAQPINGAHAACLQRLLIRVEADQAASFRERRASPKLGSSSSPRSLHRRQVRCTQTLPVRGQEPRGARSIHGGSGSHRSRWVCAWWSSPPRPLITRPTEFQASAAS